MPQNTCPLRVVVASKPYPIYHVVVLIMKKESILS